MTSEGGYSVGGLIGAIENVTVASAYARGSVSGTDRVGGLIGMMYNNFSVSYSYSTGHVTVVPDGAAGGLIGQIESEGGDLGDTNFWDVQSSGFATNHGNYPIGETTANMKTMSTFTNAGWDFTDEPIWGLVSDFNDGYPCHAWESGCEANSGNNEEENQPNVANITSATGSKAITLTVDESCTLSNVSAINSANTTTKDAGYTYTLGFVQFAASGCDDGETEVQLLYHDISPDNLVVRKYNPNNSSSAFFTISSATMTKVGNDTLVTYTVTDGGDLDIDGDENGVIVDPVGLGSLAVGTPSTGLVTTSSSVLILTVFTLLATASLGFYALWQRRSRN